MSSTTKFTPPNALNFPSQDRVFLSNANKSSLCSYEVLFHRFEIEKRYFSTQAFGKIYGIKSIFLNPFFHVPWHKRIKIIDKATKKILKQDVKVGVDGNNSAYCDFYFSKDDDYDEIYKFYAPFDLSKHDAIFENYFVPYSWGGAHGIVQIFLGEDVKKEIVVESAKLAEKKVESAKIAYKDFYDHPKWHYKEDDDNKGVKEIFRSDDDIKKMYFIPQSKIKGSMNFSFVKRCIIFVSHPDYRFYSDYAIFERSEVVESFTRDEDNGDTYYYTAYRYFKKYRQIYNEKEQRYEYIFLGNITDKTKFIQKKVGNEADKNEAEQNAYKLANQTYTNPHYGETKGHKHIKKRVIEVLWHKKTNEVMGSGNYFALLLEDGRIYYYNDTRYTISSNNGDSIHHHGSLTIEFLETFHANGIQAGQPLRGVYHLMRDFSDHFELWVKEKDTPILEKLFKLVFVVFIVVVITVATTGIGTGPAIGLSQGVAVGLGLTIGGTIGGIAANAIGSKEGAAIAFAARVVGSVIGLKAAIENIFAKGAIDKVIAKGGDLAFKEGLKQTSKSYLSSFGDKLTQGLKFTNKLLDIYNKFSNLRNMFKQPNDYGDDKVPQNDTEEFLHRRIAKAYHNAKNKERFYERDKEYDYALIEGTLLYLPSVAERLENKDYIERIKNDTMRSIKQTHR